MTKNFIGITLGIVLSLLVVVGCSANKQTARNVQQQSPWKKGNVLFISNADGDHEIYRVDSPNAKPVQLTHNDRDDTQAVWSPDGKRIAFTSMRNGNPDIYIMNRDGSNEYPVTTHSGLDASPNWSPDGSRLVFISNRDNLENIYVINLTDGDIRQISDSEAGAYGPKWSPDGKHIVYHERTPGKKTVNLHRVSPDGTNRRNLTDNKKSLDLQFSWSPDSRKIVFASKRNRAINIFSINVDGSGEMQLTDTPTADVDPQWSPHGEKILFLSQRDNSIRHQIYLMNADGSDPQNLTKNENEYLHPSWTQDGKWITFSNFENRHFVAGISRADGTERMRLSDDSGFQFQPLFSMLKQD